MDAYQVQKQQEVESQYMVSKETVVADIKDQYRIYKCLEKWLLTPRSLTDQIVLQLSPKTHAFVLRSYYEFDSSVMRDILSRKLTSRNRNLLDDISERNRVQLKSCHRQFSNVKRIFKILEETNGPIVENIQSHFCLPLKLSEQYATIIFVANIRFELGKKKLQYLTFEDVSFCAGRIMSEWSVKTKRGHSDDSYDAYTDDLDRDFFHELRDVRCLSEKESLEEVKVLMLTNLTGKLSNTARIELETNIKAYIKPLVNIACSLYHSKDFRDYFLDIVEKVIEPCKQAGFSINDLTYFLKAYRVASTFQHPKVATAFIKLWSRYTNTTIDCIIQCYHN